MKTRFVPLLISVALFTLFLPLAIASAESKSSSVQAGANLFREKGCGHCHGPELQGTHKGPALTNVRKTLKASQVANQIENGGQNMPPFGDTISHDEITHLVDFLRAKHRPNSGPVASPDAQEKSLSNPAQ